MQIVGIILPLLLQYGPEAVQAIIGLWKKQAPELAPSLAEWEALITTLSKSYSSYISDAQQKNFPSSVPPKLS